MNRRRRDLFKNRGVIGVLVRDLVSLTGSQMTWVALPWFVLTTSGSPTRMTIVLAFQTAAVALGGIAGSGIATRLGPRRTMLICDGIRAPLMAAIPLFHAAGALSFPVLVVLVVATSVFATPSFASKTVLLADLVGEDEARLGEANAVQQAAMRMTTILGPPLAGVLIGLVGATEVLLIDAATFAVGFVIVVGFVPATAAQASEDRTQSGFRALFRFLLRDRLLGPWSAAIIVGDVIWIALFATMPVLVVTRFGDEPEIVGWIFAGFGIGAVVGGVIAFRVVAGVDRLLLASVGELGMVAPLWLFLLHMDAVVLVAAMAFAGFANGLVNAPMHTLVQLRTPRHLRTALYSLVIAATSVVAPAALLATGPALEYVGVDPTLVVLLAIGSVAVLAFAAAGLRVRAAEGAAAKEQPA